MTSKLTRKQLPYIGINQIESLQTLLDTRIMKGQIQTLLYRSPRIILENYLIKLGVSPSPRIAYHGPPSSRQQQHKVASSRSASSAASSLSSPGVKTAATTRQQFQPPPPRRNLSLVEVKPRSNSMVSGNTLNFIEQLSKRSEHNKGGEKDEHDNNDDGVKPPIRGGNNTTTNNNDNDNSYDLNSPNSKFKSDSEGKYDSNV